MTAPDKVMKKISLSLLAGNTAETYSLTPSAVFLGFIFGAGSAGLTPLEVSLNDMGLGESKAIRLSSKEIEQFFGRLFISFRQAVGLHIFPETLFLRIELKSCTEAEPREIVQAMAKSLDHGGCGGSCGCGCG